MRKRLKVVELDWRKDETKRMGVTRGRDANEVVADLEKNEDAVGHETEIDEGTVDKADHRKEGAAQKIIEEKEADLEKEKGAYNCLNYYVTISSV